MLIKLRTVLVAVLCGLIVLGLSAIKDHSYRVDSVTWAQVSEVLGKLPLSFEANQGQTDAQVKFLARGSGYNIFLTPREVVLDLRKPIATGESRGNQAAVNAVLRMQFVGANPQPQVVGMEELPGKVNYFIGNDPTKWRTDIPTYAKVKYQDVYPGVDVVFYGTGRQLEFDFVVAPGADPKAITLGFQGAEQLEVDSQGQLVLHVGSEQIQLKKPVIYQEVDKARQEISGKYVLKDKDQVGFEVGAYDTTKPLIIDPIIYSTYLGGNLWDEGRGIDVFVDATGTHVYVTGSTTSCPTPEGEGFPIRNPVPYEVCGPGVDVFVTRLNPNAPPNQQLFYSTYLGEAGDNFSEDIAVNPINGYAYIVGWGGRIPTPQNTNTYQPQPDPAGGEDAFIMVLNAQGNQLVYYTYLRGSGTDRGYSIAVGPNGNAYVTGFTSSTNFPITTQNAYQANNQGGDDAFVTILNPNATGPASLVYSTYLGGSNNDAGRSITVGPNGNAYVTGFTNSTNFPTTQNAYQANNQGGNDAFVTILNPNAAGAQSLVYSTYRGTPINEEGRGIAVDANGNAYITGVSGVSGGGANALVARLPNPNIPENQQNPPFLCYFGGSRDDFGEDIAVDANGNVYVVGLTNSDDLRRVNADQNAYGGGDTDAFVVRLNLNPPICDAQQQVQLAYSTYLGGSGDEGRFNVERLKIAVEANGTIYVTGGTTSTNFTFTEAGNTTVAAYDRTYRGNRDAFVTKIVTSTSLLLADLTGRFEILRCHLPPIGRPILLSSLIVANIGNMVVNQPFLVRYELDDIIFGRRQLGVRPVNIPINIPPINPGTSITLNETFRLFPFRRCPAGRVIAILDAGNNIQELNEANNRVEGRLP